MSDPLKVTSRDRMLDAGLAIGRLLPKGRTTLHRSIWRLLGSPQRYFGQVDGQWFLVDSKDRNIAVHTVVHGYWEPAATALWLHLLKPGACVVDIGANKGFFSLLAAKRCGPNGRVISYEPLPGNASDIVATAQANGYRHWEVREAALSSKAGIAELHIPIGADGSGWGSLEASGKASHSVEVPLVRFSDDADELGLRRIDLLKMDIQGHELDALQGTVPMLERGDVDQLVIEVHQHILGDARVRMIFDLLDHAGYSARMLDESALSPDAWRSVVRGSTVFDEARFLIPVDGPDHARLPKGTWFKALWEREK